MARVRGVPAGRIVALLALFLLCAVVVLPVIVVMAGSFWSGRFVRMAGQPTLDHYASIAADPFFGELLWTTLQMTLGASLLAMFLGGGLAWIIARTDVPARSLLWWLPVAPMLISSLLANTGWVALYGPKAGLVNLLLMNVFGLKEPPFDIYSMAGLIASLGTHLTPIPYLILLGPLRSMSQSVDEASRASGARPLRTLFKVTLPLLMPALLAGFTLTAILVTHAFETPVIIGLTAGIYTYMSVIYQSMTGQVNYSLASAQAIIYLALIGALLLWNRRLTRVEARFALIAGRGHAPGTVRLGWWRWVAFAAVLVVFVLSFGQLLAVNVFISLLPFYTTTGALPAMGFDNYVESFRAPGNLESIRNSVVLAAVVSVLCALAATFLAYIAFKTRMPGRRLAEELGTLPVAFPPLFFSVALLITFLSIPGMVVFYNSVFLLVLALLVIFLPFAVRTVGSAMITIDNGLLEASASSGASAFRTMRSITLPLIATALAGAMALVFIFSFRELGGIALVTPPSVGLLPTAIYAQWQTGFLRNVYALNVISFLVTVAVFLISRVALGLLSRGRAASRAREAVPAEIPGLRIG